MMSESIVLMTAAKKAVTTTTATAFGKPPRSYFVCEATCQKDLQEQPRTLHVRTMTFVMIALKGLGG